MWERPRNKDALEKWGSCKNEEEKKIKKPTMLYFGVTNIHPRRSGDWK